MVNTHKFSLRTTGLSDEQAAQLHYLISCSAHALVNGDEDRYDSISNVSVRDLRGISPRGRWKRASAADRVALVK